jgi:DNA-binding FadR family transcriptional regulator
MPKVLTDVFDQFNMFNMLRREFSLVTELVEQLRTVVERPDTRPGDLLGTKKELSERFSVSLASLNEALRILQSRGLVMLRSGPRGGVFAATPQGHLRLANLVLSFRADSQTMNDAMVVRDSLEAAVWLDVAEQADSSQIGGLRDWLHAMGDLEAGPEDYLRSNWEFHTAAARLCRNRILRETYLGAVDIMTEALDSVEQGEQDPGSRVLNVQAHEALVNAALSRDPERIAVAVIDHAVGGRVDTEEYLARVAAHSTVLPRLSKPASAS